MKPISSQGPGAADGNLVQQDLKFLTTIHSTVLVEVLAPSGSAVDTDVVMDYVHGKTLEEIRARAEAVSALLPPELGLVVAHDTLAALQYFHDFEGANRVHGNISTRTILLNYSGEVKVAGYRPGAHVHAPADVLYERDVRPLATILCELPFRTFPRELTQLIPRLLEDHVSPMEALAATKAFLAAHAPSSDDRRRLASWLEGLFPGERARGASEIHRLVFAGKALLARSHAEQRRPIPAVVTDDGSTPMRMPPPRRSRPRVLVAGTVVLLVVAGSAALVMASRRGHRIASFDKRVLMSKDLPELALRSVASAPAPTSSSAPSAPAAVAPEPAVLARVNDITLPSVTPRCQTQRAPEVARRTGKARAGGPHVDELLRSAEAEFETGHRVEAVELGRQAAKAGGGSRADLALGKYYQSMHLYREAMEHYRAVVAVDPGNGVAMTGIRLLEKRLPPCQ